MMFQVFSSKRHISSQAIKSHYDTLSVPRNATSEEIKEAYYKKAKDCHPDISQGTAAEFQKLKEAYETLFDPVRRRAYDAATRHLSGMGNFSSTYTTHRASNPETYSRQKPVEFKHDYIQHVYKTINRDDIDEPKFRPFEDHHYPGSNFNRFEYSRSWDTDSKTWVYKKRSTAKAYNDMMTRKSANLSFWVTVITGAIVFNIFAYKFLLKGISSQSSKPSEDAKRGTRGMYIIPDSSNP